MTDNVWGGRDPEVENSFCLWGGHKSEEDVGKWGRMHDMQDMVGHKCCKRRMHSILWEKKEEKFNSEETGQERFHIIASF